MPVCPISPWQSCLGRCVSNAQERAAVLPKSDFGVQAGGAEATLQGAFCSRTFCKNLKTKLKIDGNPNSLQSAHTPAFRLISLCGRGTETPGISGLNKKHRVGKEETKNTPASKTPSELYDISTCPEDWTKKRQNISIRSMVVNVPDTFLDPHDQFQPGRNRRRNRNYADFSA